MADKKIDYKQIVSDFKKCECGSNHECSVKDIRAFGGAVAKVGEILVENDFPKKLLLVADKKTLAAADGIVSALKDFDLTFSVYDDLRVATMAEVKAIESYFKTGIAGVIAVGTGSVHDICRLACAEADKPLCLFATAPSMDGFASYSAPIVDNNFKITYPAKCPEVIIADTKILSAAPNELKSAGFGDMMAKYVALVDWRVSHLITGESYCEKVAELTRRAADLVFDCADEVLSGGEEGAEKIFWGLIMTGIAMSFTKTSRPGSGTEHIMSHYIECKELAQGKIPRLHGEDVGVCTLAVLRLYDSILGRKTVTYHRENNDWQAIKAAYGVLSPEMMALNTPDTITDSIIPKSIEEHFEEVKQIVASVPSYADVYEKMKSAGCKTSYKDLGISEEFFNESMKFHPYMRRRLSLRRLLNMTDIDVIE